MAEQQTSGAFSWTQFAGVPPGLDLLGPLTGLALADVGCGRGRTAAALAAAGAQVTGVDIDATVIGHAQADHGGAGVTFVVADAATFLLTHPTAFDLVVSKFGGLDFAPLGPLLVAARGALRPGGRLVASSRHPDWERICRHLGLGAGRPGDMKGNRVHNWAQRNLLDRARWHEQLSRAGYYPTRVSDIYLPRATLANYVTALTETEDHAESVDALAKVPACTVMVAEVASC